MKFGRHSKSWAAAGRRIFGDSNGRNGNGANTALAECPVETDERDALLESATEDEAMDAAKKAEQRYVKGNPRPLEGVPLAVKDEFMIKGKTVNSMLGWFMTYPFNILSRCPVLSIPTGKASNNVPTGMQLVGPTYEDITVFQAAAAFESAVGQFFSPSNCPDLKN